MEAPQFTIVLRGYDRDAVDRYVRKVTQQIRQLERTQTREGVVQNALEEVGHQTSAILQQANDSAAEITARARSQAEGMLARAEREADQIVADAEERAERLERETTALWEERGRLIEEVRQMAEDTLAVADDALERLPPPSDETPAAEADAQPSDSEPTRAIESPEELEPTAEVRAERS